MGCREQCKQKSPQGWDRHRAGTGTGLGRYRQDLGSQLLRPKNYNRPQMRMGEGLFPPLPCSPAPTLVDCAAFYPGLSLAAASCPGFQPFSSPPFTKSHCWQERSGVGVSVPAQLCRASRPLCGNTPSLSSVVLASLLCLQQKHWLLRAKTLQPARPQLQEVLRLHSPQHFPKSSSTCASLPHGGLFVHGTLWGMSFQEQGSSLS